MRLLYPDHHTAGAVKQGILLKLLQKPPPKKRLVIQKRRYITCSRNTRAQLESPIARLGWSGPRACSRVLLTFRYSKAASSFLPCEPSASMTENTAADILAGIAVRSSPMCLLSTLCIPTNRRVRIRNKTVPSRSRNTTVLLHPPRSSCCEARPCSDTLR